MDKVSSSPLPSPEKPQEQSVPSQSSKKTSCCSCCSKPIWCLLIAVFLVVALVFGGYYLWARTYRANHPLGPPPVVVPKVARPTLTTDPTANWKTWKNDQLNYEFKYPLDWEVGDSEFGSPTSVIQQPQKNYYLAISYVSQSQLSVMGVTYCGAYPNDAPRCELFKINEKTSAGIDWGPADSERHEVSVQIGHPEGGIITFSLSPVNSETKSILYKILSTFKFLDQSQAKQPLKQADANKPASGVCSGPPAGDTAAVIIDIDTPSPRCLFFLKVNN